MIDTFPATVVAVGAGCAIVLAAARIRGRSRRATRWAVFACLCGGVLLAWLDWWASGGNLDYAEQAEVGGLSLWAHRWILVAIILWTALVTVVVAVRRPRLPDHDEEDADQPSALT